MFRSKTARPSNLTRASVAGALIALPLVAFAPIAAAATTPDPNEGPGIVIGVDQNGLPIVLGTDEYSDDEYSDDEYSDDEYSDDGYSDDEYSDDGYSDDEDEYLPVPIQVDAAEHSDSDSDNSEYSDLNSISGLIVDPVQPVDVVPAADGDNYQDSDSESLSDNSDLNSISGLIVDPVQPVDVVPAADGDNYQDSDSESLSGYSDLNSISDQNEVNLNEDSD
ncbi:hypothetical protein [Mycobacterium decipiens]|uniref:hypothetical protein n=1 Tax=Mycobacterium decipiens TaxID=1430326 RepID=UPI0031013EF5